MLHRFHEDRYNDQLPLLGDISEVNDTTFYLVYKPHNGIGATIEQCGKNYNLQLMHVDSYEPLTMWTHPDHQYWNLSEDEAWPILLHQFGVA